MQCSLCQATFQEKKKFQEHLTMSGHRTGQTKTQAPMPVLPAMGAGPAVGIAGAAFIPMTLVPMGAAYGGKVAEPKKTGAHPTKDPKKDPKKDSKKVPKKGPTKGSRDKKPESQVFAYEKKHVAHERVEGKIVKKKQKTMEAFILLDTSGSMIGPKIGEAQAGAVELLDAFSDTDLLTLVQFSSDVKICQGSKATIVGHIREMKANGSTELNSAIISALERMRPDLHGVQIIVLTDGSATDIHKQEHLFRLLDENKDKRNVRITVIQVGLSEKTPLDTKISALKAKNIAMQNIGYTVGAIKNVLSEMKANVITATKTIVSESINAKRTTAGADISAIGVINRAPSMHPMPLAKHASLRLGFVA